MDKDIALETLFLNFTPDLGSEDEFMERLNKRLAAVEYIKEVHDKQVKLYRLAIPVAFVLGVVLCGTVLTASMLLRDSNPTIPSDLSLIHISYLFVKSYNILFLVGTAILIAIGIILIVSQWQEYANLKYILTLKRSPETGSVTNRCG